jgi:hypothetical protein
MTDSRVSAALGGQAISPAASPGQAPSPSIGAAAQWELAHPAPANSIVNVFFTLVLTGPDAVVGLFALYTYKVTLIVMRATDSYETRFHLAWPLPQSPNTVP